MGAKATAGARYVNFYPNAFGNVIDDWNQGDVSFDTAVGESDTDAVRTVAQTFISLVDAPGLPSQAPPIASAAGRSSSHPEEPV